MSAGNAQWEARKRRAFYIPHGAGLIDWLVAATFHAEPRIMATGDDADYWLGLNKNVDGNGTDLPTMLRDALLDLMIAHRPFLSINFPNSGSYANFEAQKNAGATDARISVIKTMEVTDFQPEGIGYEWVRTYRRENVRSKPWKPADMTRELWCFVTNKDITEYEITYANSEPPKDTQEIPTKPPKPHALGALPMVPVRIPYGLWVANRICDTQCALFNREASITWALDMQAYAQAVAKLENPSDTSSMVSNEACIVALKTTEDFDFKAPPVGAFDALSKDADRLKGNLYEVLQAMAIVAASQPQNARQSGDAKEWDRAPLEALLRSFAFPIKNALTQALARIKDFRKSKAEISIDGLDSFDVQALADKITNAGLIATVPGMPATAKKWLNRDIGLSIATNAPAETRQEIITEAEQFDPEQEAADEAKQAVALAQASKPAQISAKPVATEPPKKTA